MIHPEVAAFIGGTLFGVVLVIGIVWGLFRAGGGGPRA